MPRSGLLLVLVGMAALVGCAGLRPLPSPSLAPCPDGAPLDAFWHCLDGTDRETKSGIAAAQPRESAFKSTTRISHGDSDRKRRDQRAATACGGPRPPGFDLWDADAPGPGRAPLRAYVHPPQPGRATVIVVHGLYDSKHSRYIRVTTDLLARAGFGVVAVDMRFHGCLLSGWLPTLGVEEGLDLIAWSGLVRQRFPGSPVGLLGYSLGALDVIHALATDPDGAAFPAGGIAVSPPANLALSLTRLDDPPSFADHGLQRFIGGFFQDALRTRMRDLGVPRAERPFAGFLEWITQRPGASAPATPADFVAAGDPVPYLARVRSPLLLIASRRDPILFEGAILELRRAAAGQDHLHLVETTDGGHIGQIGRYPAWSAEIFTRFFAGSATLQ